MKNLIKELLKLRHKTDNAKENVAFIGKYKYLVMLLISLPGKYFCELNIDNMKLKSDSTCEIGIIDLQYMHENKKKCTSWHSYRNCNTF